MSAPIYITVPNNYLVEDVDSKSGILESPLAPRKRKLDHLTWEEKMQRKKLKNRVAAQTSRDRKKAKMDEMESRIQHLEDLNHKLASDMASLKALNERLLGENEKLRAASNVSGAQRPAESTPQQKEGPLKALPAARLLLAMCLLSQTSSTSSTPRSTLTRSINWQSPSSKRLMEVLQERLKMSNGNVDNVLKQMKWWGPQQSTWNPVEVRS